MRSRLPRLATLDLRGTRCSEIPCYVADTGVGMKLLEQGPSAQLGPGRLVVYFIYIVDKNRQYRR